ncbi:MAG: hypothetical protein AAF797_09190 [Planctomycetota bacterium]
MTSLDEFRAKLSGRIDDLPLVARAAFATRCARRIASLTPSIIADEPTSLNITLSHLVDRLEEALTGHMSGDDWQNKFLPTPQVRKFFNDIATTDQEKFAVNCVLHAADAVDNIFRATFDPTQAVETGCAAYLACSDSVDHILRDLRSIELLKDSESWTDETTVAISVLGPLWPDGQPKDWPDTSSEDCELVFEIDLPDGATDQEVKRRLIKLSGELDSLHRSYGGRGLRVVGLDVPREAPAFQGVSS